MAVFGSCMFRLSRRKREQGVEISGKEVFWNLAFSVYMVLLLGCTLLNRSVGEGQGLRLTPVWSWREVLDSGNMEVEKQIFYNILAFVPWGILVPKCFDNARSFAKVVGSAVLMSVGIEVMQLIGQCGLCELDDVIHNGLGAVVGYLVWRMVHDKYGRE